MGGQAELLVQPWVIVRSLQLQAVVFWNAAGNTIPEHFSVLTVDSDGHLGMCQR
jgi:hypothetical protein